MTDGQFICVGCGTVRKVSDTKPWFPCPKCFSEWGYSWPEDAADDARISAASRQEWAERAWAAEAERDRLRSALTRQSDNMAFILNRVTLPDAWYHRFLVELKSDRTALKKAE